MAVDEEEQRPVRLRRARHHAAETSRVERAPVPGKQTLAENLPPGRPDPRGPLRWRFTGSEASIARLGDAIAHRDFAGASLAAAELRLAFNHAEQLLGQVADEGAPDLVELQWRFDELAARAQPLLARAPRRETSIAPRELHERDAIAWRRSLDQADTGTKHAAESETAHEADAPPGPQPLPDEIRGDLEAATGGSLAHVRLHDDPHGHEVAASHDARAVAIGADIYMGEGQLDASSPDGRELLAHEVAHVEQARAHPGPERAAAKRDDESTENAAEREADDFGAAFRSEGRSASWTPSVGVNGTTAMRKPGAGASAGSTPTPSYVNQHRAAILSVIGERITTAGVPQPHPRLPWTALAEGARAVSAAIRTYVDAAPDVTLKRLMALSFPADLFAIVSQARRGAGGVSAVARAVAHAFDAPITASVGRMGMRLRVYLDGHGSLMPHAASVLVASNPLDGVVAEVLVRRGLVLNNPTSRRKGDDTPGKPFARGVREVEYEWMGARDPALWNWIHVTAPKHATAEHVAHTPLAGGEVMDGSERAHRIAASPPYFGIPFETAKLVPEAVSYAPPELQAQLETGPGPRVADATALARSAASDEAALAQARAPKKHDPPAERTAERAHDQLEFLNTQLDRWSAAGPLDGASKFVERRRSEIARDPRQAQRWQSVLASQERILHAVASDVAEMMADLEQRGAKPSDAAALAPIVRALEAYARAASVSHLGAQGPASLAEARELRTLLPLALTEHRLQLAGRAITAESGSKSEQADVGAYQDLTARAADLRMRLARGKSVDSKAVDELAVDTDELSVRAKLGTIETNLLALEKRADAAGYTKEQYEHGLPTARALPAKLMPEIARWRERLDEVNRPGQSLDVKRSAVSVVAAQIESFGKKSELDKWLPDAHERIADKELRNAISSIALQIGIMIFTGHIAGAAVAAIRGAALAGGLLSQLRSTSLLFKAGEIVLHSGLATAAQGATGGPAGGQAFAENLLGNVFSAAAMKPFIGLLKGGSKVEQDVIRSWGQFAKKSAKVATELTLDLGTGVGASALARMATHGAGLSIASSQEWLTQGISLAAARFVHQRTQGMHERLTEAVRQHGPKRFEKLMRKVEVLLRRSSASKEPSSEDAISQLAQSRALLREEHALYQPGSKAARASGEQLSALGAEFLDVPFQLKGLSPVVDGHRYEGTPKQISDAFAAADAIGVPTKRERDPDTGVWRVTSGKRTLEIREIRIGGARPSKRTDQATSAIDTSVKGVSPARMAQLRRMIALGEIDPATLPPHLKPHLPTKPGIDAGTAKAWGRDLANSNPNKMTDEQVKADLDAYLKRKEHVQALYEKAKSGEIPEVNLPGGVTLKQLKLAVEGDVDGQRIPLTFSVSGGRVSHDLGAAKKAFDEFQTEIAAVFKKHGITDAVVVQLGSGTTGWSTAPGTIKGTGKPKVGKPWSPSSDTDFAIFSDQALMQAMHHGAIINPKNQQAGKYTTIKNSGTAPGERGFADTPLGKDLLSLAVDWNKRVYGSGEVDGFDFKLNLESSKPFRSAVPILQAQPQLVPLSMGKAGVRAERVRAGQGGTYLGIKVEDPRHILPPGAKYPRDYHITIITPPEMASLTSTSRAKVERGIDVGGLPQSGEHIMSQFAGIDVHKLKVIWPEAQALRHRLGLRDADLHVTLSGGIGDAVRANGERDKRPPHGSEGSAE